MSEKKLIVIAGPTAVGKTAVSIELAKRIGTEIISCDSRQLYKEMPIGTAAPTVEEMQGVPHHFIGSHSVAEEVSAGDYERIALDRIALLFKSLDHLIVVGGSGLYLRALLHGFDNLPETSVSVREKVKAIYTDGGLDALQSLLAKLDPVYYEKVDRQNHARLMRALEVCLVSGKPYSSFLSGISRKRPFSVFKVFLNTDRSLLHQRINDRVDAMMAKGLPEEVKALTPFRHKAALQTVGYKELFGFFDGKIPLDKAVEDIKTNTRRYARRQITWFGREEHDLTADPLKEDVIGGILRLI